MKKIIWPTRLLFLVLFIMLFLKGRLNMWIVIFGLGLILTLLLGKVYCGYMCPMNTVMIPTEVIAKKLGIKHKNGPKWIKYKFSWVVLLLSVGGMVIMKRVYHMNMPILFGLFILSIIMSFIFKPDFFHNKICPFGALLSLVGKVSLFSKKVNQDNCIGCNKCVTVCHAGSIEKKDKKVTIVKNMCFQCSNCSDVCPKEAISYGR